MNRILLLFLILMLASSASAAGYGLLPYKDTTTTGSGIEYTKLVYTLAQIHKGVSFESPLKLKRELAQKGTNISKTITARDLTILGKEKGLQYILLGTLSRTEKYYRVKSLLFSVQDSRIIDSYTLQGRNLSSLAHREIMRVFQKQKTIDYISGTMRDTVFILEAGTAMRDIWNDIKNGVLNYTSETVDRNSFNSRVWAVPVSSQVGVTKSIMVNRNSKPLLNWFSVLKPRGIAGEREFSKAISYTLNTLKFRMNSQREIIIVTAGSPEINNYSRLAYLARKKNIIITWIDMSGCRKSESDFNNFIRSSNGTKYHGSYQQKAFDLQGEPLFIYFEDCRLFTSMGQHLNWRGGILKGDKRFKKPQPGFQEITSHKSGLTRHNFSHYFSRASSLALLNKKLKQSNASSLITSRLETLSSSKGFRGRALVSDGKISIWITGGRRTMGMLAKAEGYHWYSGYIKSSRNSTYGYTLSLLPVNINKRLRPQSISTTLTSIAKGDKKSQKLVIVRLKVLNTEHYKEEQDIRTLKPY